MLKRIAVIGAKGFPAWGGAASANEHIFSILSSEYDITIYALASHANLSEYNRMKQIIFKACKNVKVSVFLYYIKSLLHALFAEDYDLIHVNHRSAGYIVPFLRIKYPVVFNIHGLLTQYKEDKKWKNSELKLFELFQLVGFKTCSAVISVDSPSLAYIKRFKSKNVYYIPNGISIEKNDIIYSKSPNFDITFSAARIIPLKGLHTLLQALDHINFDGKIQIIGDLTQMDDYKSEIIKLSDNLNCEFVGLIKNKDELFSKIKNTKIYVFPSFTEGMSTMLLEVVSLKIPVIASDIPQNKSIFNDDEMTFFNVGNFTDLGNKIKWGLSNYNSLIEKANKAYFRAANDYNWDKISQSYNDVYKQFLKK